MSGRRVRLALQQDLEPLSRLIVEQVRNPATRCLHSETGESREATYDELAGLHDATFPATYITGQGMLARCQGGGGEDHRLLACVAGEAVLGYLYASLEPGSGEGIVDHSWASSLRGTWIFLW